MKRRILYAVFHLFFVLTISPAWAGSQQNGESQYPLEKTIAFTQKIESIMASKGARIFIIGRIGRASNSLPPDVNYTHAAFGVYSLVTTEDGQTIPTYAYYNLYQDEDNEAKSHLATDYTINFLTGIYEGKVGIIIPTAKLQQRLLGFIGTADYRSLHNPRYSVLANPNSLTYQNCTEYVLDVLNASIYNTTDKTTLKRIATELFESQEIDISPFKLMLGSLFASGVRTSDHTGPIKTVTFTTIAHYLKTFHLSQEELTIHMDK